MLTKNQQRQYASLRQAEAALRTAVHAMENALSYTDEEGCEVPDGVDVSILTDYYSGVVSAIFTLRGQMDPMGREDDYC
jgi:Tfp pilus assembly protein PilX